MYLQLLHPRRTRWTNPKLQPYANPDPRKGFVLISLCFGTSLYLLPAQSSFLQYHMSVTHLLAVFTDWTDSVLVRFPPRLLHAVHSVEMILTWLIVFQASTNPKSVWKFNFAPVFVLKYSLFLINNFLLPSRVPFSIEPYSDFLILLAVLFWSQKTILVNRLIACLKNESVDSRLKFLFRLSFYFLLFLFRTASVFAAVQRYLFDPISLWISCMILFEFTSLIIYLKRRNFAKFYPLLTSSIIIASIVAIAPHYRVIVIPFFFYRHVVNIIRNVKIVRKSIPVEGRPRQPHRQRPKRTTRTSSN